MRKSELMGLRWNDIDFNNNLAYLADTKNGSPSVNPIPEVAMHELKKFRQVGNSLVFSRPDKMNKDGTITHVDKPFHFRKQWKKALADANITDYRFHDNRHSAASYLVMGGEQAFMMQVRFLGISRLKQLNVTHI